MNIKYSANFKMIGSNGELTSISLCDLRDLFPIGFSLASKIDDETIVISYPDAGRKSRIIKAPYIYPIGSDHWLIVLETRTGKRGLSDNESFLDNHPLIETYAIYSEDIVNFMESLPLELRTNLGSYLPSDEPYSLEEYAQITMEELEIKIKNNEIKIKNNETKIKEIEIKIKEMEEEQRKLEEADESSSETSKLEKTHSTTEL